MQFTLNWLVVCGFLLELGGLYFLFFSASFREDWLYWPGGIRWLADRLRLDLCAVTSWGLICLITGVALQILAVFIV